MDEDFDSSTAAAWTRFQARLADHLLEMEEDDLLLIEAESSLDDDDGAAPYVQFCAWGPGEVRCEAVSNAYLAEPHLLDGPAASALVELGFEAPTYGPGEDADSGSANFWVDVGSEQADRLAVMTVRALRDVYGVAHPAFLSGLPSDEDEAVEEPAAPISHVSDSEPAVYPEDGPEHLQGLVDEALTPVIGHVPVHDDDGDIPIDCGAVTVFVRVFSDKPVIRLFACVARGVMDRQRATFEIGVLNRDRLFLKFLLIGDAVVVQTDIVAWPFAPAHLRDVLDHLCRSVDQLHDDLEARLGSGEEADDSLDEESGESLHPALLTLLQLDADEPGSVDATLAAAICEHDRELILELLTWCEQQGDLDQAARMTKLLRGALRVTVERHAKSVDRAGSGGRHRSTRRGGSSRRRVPDPTLEEVDPEMWS